MSSNNYNSDYGNDHKIQTYTGYNGNIPIIKDNGMSIPLHPTGKPSFPPNINVTSSAKKAYLQIPTVKKKIFRKKRKKKTFLKPNLMNKHKSHDKKGQSTFNRIISQLKHANPNQNYRKIKKLTSNMPRKNALQFYMALTKKNPKLKPKGWY